MRKVICSIVCALLLVSCGEYNKILKSTDYELKYDYAKKAFERKKYMQAATLLEELVAIFKGTDRAEECVCPERAMVYGFYSFVFGAEC